MPINLIKPTSSRARVGKTIIIMKITVAVRRNSCARFPTLAAAFSCGVRFIVRCFPSSVKDRRVEEFSSFLRNAELNSVGLCAVVQHCI